MSITCCSYGPYISGDRANKNTKSNNSELPNMPAPSMQRGSPPPMPVEDGDQNFFPFRGLNAHSKQRQQMISLDSVCNPSVTDCDDPSALPWPDHATPATAWF